MSESPSQAGKEIPTKKQKLSSDENSNPDLSGDENVRSRIGLFVCAQLTNETFSQRQHRTNVAGQLARLAASSFVQGHGLK